MSNRCNGLFLILTLLFTAVLVFLPTGFERTYPGERVKMEVLKTDDSGVHQYGIIKTGDQRLNVKILGGTFKNTETEAVNHLTGKLEFDRIYAKGDVALAALDSQGNEIVKVTALDYYRLNVQLLLLAVFCVPLLLFAGWVGVRSLLSFFFTAMVLWKILLPGLLKGWNPVLASLGTTTLLTVVIIFLVSGFDRKGLTAVLGSLGGIALTCTLALIFGRLFAIHGAVKPFSETLLYSGFPHLNLTEIFLGGIFLASSGAVMDVSMDIASALHEIALKKPDITSKELIFSGFAVGRMIIGTMTTTLLLAYTGGFMTLLMVFVAQGTPFVNILNIQYVAAEALHTLVGSVGLLSVAPLTALVGGWLMAPSKESA